MGLERSAKRHWASVVCVLIAGWCGGSTVMAVPIMAGFDLWNTTPGTSVDLGPGIGVVSLTGTDLPGLGNTDTIIERKAGASLPVESVPIELVALSLRSVAPIDVGGMLFDVMVISGSLLGEPANPLGTMTIDHSLPNGGVFIVDLLPVDAKVTLTEVGNPTNVTSQQVFVEFVGAQGIWGHQVGMMDQHTLDLPAGGFYPGIDPDTGEKLPVIKHSAGPGYPPGHMHVVRPSMPEPTTLTLLLSASILLGGRRAKCARAA